MTAHIAAVVIEGTMTGITTPRAGAAGGTGAPAPIIGEAEAGARGTVAQIEKVVKRDALKSSNGTGKRNKQSLLTGKIMLEVPTVRVTGICKMAINTMASSNHNRVDIDTDVSIIWLVPTSYYPSRCNISFGP